MIFLELLLQNFGPYQGKQTIDLRPTSKNQPRPIILFGGMNGGGKTTLVDAIRLALYGQRAQCSTRGNLSYSEFLSQSVNRNTPPNENTRIELAFEHVLDDRFVEYRIVRTWNKNPKDGKDQLGILDGEWPDEYLAKTWDEYIENLLPLGISNLFLFDGEQVKELAEQETPPPVVVDAIQSLLGLELAERLAADLDILLGRKRKELASKKELADLDEIEKNLGIYNQEYAEAKENLETLKKLKHKAEKRHRQATNKFITEGGKIAAEKHQLSIQLNKTTEDIDKNRLEMAELAAFALPLGLISGLLEEASLQANHEIFQKEGEIALEAFRDRDRRLLDYLQELSLTSHKIEKIQAFLDRENQTLEADLKSEDEIWLMADNEALTQLENLLGYQLNSDRATAREKLELLGNQEMEMVSLEKQIAAAAAPEKYQQLENAVREAQTELAKAEASCEAGERLCRQLEDAIAKVKKQLSNYTDKTIDRQNAQHLIASCGKVQKTLQLFKQKLTLKKLNKLEVEVTECFRYLLHKSDLVHRVAIDTGTFAISLYDPEGLPVQKHRLSAGEKQLLAISFLWGLARVSGRRLPVAIDTPLGRLDSSHRHHLVERYFPSASHQVILLSTDTEIGKTEVKHLRESGAIAREYLLEYDSSDRQTTLKKGYFW